MSEQVERNSVPVTLQEASRALGQMVQKLKPSGEKATQNNNPKDRTQGGRGF